MLTIDGLREYGADVDSGLARCMGNEEFYLKMVNMMLADNSFARLKEALAEGNLDAAFDAAHAFKGVSTNLSLTPLSDPVVEMTELLRARTEMDYTPLLEKASEQYDKLVQMAS